MTDTTDPTESPEPMAESRGPSARLAFGVAFGLGLIATLVLGVSGLYAYDRQFAGRILPGVHVGKVDLSGLTVAEARPRLQAAYGSLSNGRLVLTGSAGEQVISFVDVGRGPDLEAMLDAAVRVGEAGTPIDRAVAAARTAVRGVVLPPRVTFDPARLRNRVTAVAASLGTAARDARVEGDGQGRFVVVAGAAGETADPSEAIAAFAASLGEVDAPPELRAPLIITTIDPAVTTVAATDAKAQAERLTDPIVVVAGDERVTIDSAQLRSWITFTAAGGTYQPTLDSSPLTKLVGKLAPKVDRDPVNATFTIEGGKVSGITPSKDGYKLDVAATVGQIQGLLSGRREGFAASQIAPTLTVTSPVLTTAQAEAAAPEMQLISDWTTYFPISEKNGFGANIWIPALTIDGTIVGPHETFDFWDAIGPVTRDKGYVDGGAIINGKSEPQGALAGGICSCSTTLFNAALRAGFEMGARRNHFYYISRYPLGLDATVFISASGAVQTMSWTNDTDYPVLIRGYKIQKGARGYVKFELYSVPTGRRVVIGDPTVKNVKPATDTTQLTSTLPPGVHKRIEFPVDGKQVWRTRTVYDAAGNVIHMETYYSNYARITGITLIGAPVSTADPSTNPTPTP